MTRFRSALLDFFFPPHCIYCDAIVDQFDHPVCQKCESETNWIPDNEPPVKGKYFSACVAPAWYMDEVRKAILDFKFRGRTEHAKVFARALCRSITLHFAGDYDLLTWLPVSPERRQERGYDQSFLLAEAVSAILEQPLTPSLAKTHTKAQSSLEGVAARRKNVQGAFSVPEPLLVQGRTVLLIDDLITTGSTMDSACKALMEAGASRVLCACFARSAPELREDG